MEVLLAAIEMGLDNSDLVRLGIAIKGKAFVKMADARRKGDELPAEEPAPPAAAATGGKENSAQQPVLPDQKKASKGGEAPAHLYELGPEQFAGLMIKDVFHEVLEKKTVPTVCYMQPSPPAVGIKEEPGLSAVGIEHAFASPQTLTNCSDFLKKHIAETKAQSAMLVVRKGHMTYPCVWKGKKKELWPHDAKQDGIFMQLEARGARAVFFTSIGKAKGGGYTVGDTSQLDAEVFGLFPRLFG